MTFTFPYGELSKDEINELRERHMDVFVCKRDIKEYACGNLTDSAKEKLTDEYTEYEVTVEINQAQEIKTLLYVLNAWDLTLNVEQGQFGFYPIIKANRRQYDNNGCLYARGR